MGSPAARHAAPGGGLAETGDAEVRRLFRVAISMHTNFYEDQDDADVSAGLVWAGWGACIGALKSEDAGRLLWAAPTLAYACLPVIASEARQSRRRRDPAQAVGERRYAPRNAAAIVIASERGSSDAGAAELIQRDCHVATLLAMTTE